MSKHKTHLLLGGNLGDRHANLASAKRLIGQRIGTVVKASSLYETQPWGKPDQPDFLNQALEVATDLNPDEVLKAILNIEKELGRQREDKWDARTIDIDILFYDAKVLKTKDLTLPHPHLHERNFALVPMLEIAPNKQHPIFKKTIEELYEACNDELEVVMLDEEEPAQFQNQLT
jgi:2-amino-4-hydroxy-6-hydroxymethyldihydropteridine diphosphokinase